MEEWLQDITLYHKETNKYIRYNLTASVRNTSIQNRNNTGVSNVEKAIIRIFDIKGYKHTRNISKGDIIVNKSVKYDIEKAPVTELRQLYGEENVYTINSIDVNIFNDDDLPSHIKIGAI